MASRFVDAGSVDEFISEQENKSTAKKTLRDVKLLQLFLVTKNQERNIGDIDRRTKRAHGIAERIRAVFSSKFTSIYLQVLSMT